MRRLVSLFAVLILFLGCLSCLGQSKALALGISDLNLQSAPSLVALQYRNAADDKLAEVRGEKINLNNSHVRDFRKIRGFYPNLAGKIVKYSPYEQVEDVLKIPGLSERQKQRLQANLDNFVVTEAVDVYNDGDDRYNPGVY